MLTPDEIKALNRDVQIPLFLTMLGADPKNIIQLGSKPDYRCNAWYRNGDNPHSFGCSYNYSVGKWHCSDFIHRTFTNIDLIDLAVDYFGKKFREALDLLIFCCGKDNGVGGGNVSFDLSKGAQPKLEHPVPIDPKIFETFEKGLHPFWVNRGYTPEIADRFKLGWSKYGELKDRLTIPIVDEKGYLVSVQGRTIDDRIVPKYKFLDGTGESAKLTLYNYRGAFNAIQQRGWVGVTEGANAVWRAYQYGFQNFVASLSTSVTERQLDLIMHLKTNVVIFFDFDATETMSGQINSIKLANQLLSRGHNGVYVANIGFHSGPEDLTLDQFVMTLKNTMHYK